MEAIKRINKMLTYNLKTLLKFEFLFKIMTALVFMPLFIQAFKLTMKITGFSYLTIENIINFVLNPFTIILLLILVIVMTIYTLFDLIGIIIIFDESIRGDKIRLFDVIKASAIKCIKFLRPNNILICFFVLFMIPFLNFGISSNVISSLEVPEFIMDFINGNMFYTVIYWTAVSGLTILLIRWVYSLHYMVLEDVSFRKARKKSINLGKKRHIKDILSWSIVQIVNSSLYTFVIIIGVLGISLLNSLMINHLIWETIIVTFLAILIAITMILFMMLSTPISYVAISNSFYRNKELKKEERVPFDVKNTKAKEKTVDVYKKVKIAISMIVILGVLGGSFLSYVFVSGKANVNIEMTRNMEITAHRGASIRFPENTMAAFKGAKDLGADWIELDVQQTKDGKIIVAHDTNFKRVCKVDKNVWEVTLDEVKTYDAGSFFSKEFAGEKIPTLEETIDFAKLNNIRLNIELKPTGKEENFEKNVLDIIKQKNFKDRCVITSQNYAVLENVKDLDSNVKTIYVMSIGIGDLLKLDKADGYSLEATNVTKKLVKKLHNNGKEVYAWTVNTEDNINKMIDLNVDNIITDNIELGQTLVEESKTMNILTIYESLLEKVF